MSINNTLSAINNQDCIYEERQRIAACEWWADFPELPPIKPDKSAQHIQRLYLQVWTTWRRDDEHNAPEMSRKQRRQVLWVPNLGQWTLSCVTRTTLEQSEACPTDTTATMLQSLVKCLKSTKAPKTGTSRLLPMVHLHRTLPKHPDRLVITEVEICIPLQPTNMTCFIAKTHHNTG